MYQLRSDYDELVDDNEFADYLAQETRNQIEEQDELIIKPNRDLITSPEEEDLKISKKPISIHEFLREAWFRLIQKIFDKERNKRREKLIIVRSMMDSLKDESDEQFDLEQGEIKV